MALETGAIQAVATAFFGAASAFFYWKMDKSKKQINGHLDDLTKVRRRVYQQGRRLKRLEADARSFAVDGRELQNRIERLEARGS